MKQYAVYLGSVPVEYTGYFKSPAAVRKYLKSRYTNKGEGLTFRAVYPTVETKVYSVA